MMFGSCYFLMDCNVHQVHIKKPCFVDACRKVWLTPQYSSIQYPVALPLSDSLLHYIHTLCFVRCTQTRLSQTETCINRELSMRVVQLLLFPAFRILLPCGNLVYGRYEMLKISKNFNKIRICKTYYQTAFIFMFELNYPNVPTTLLINSVDQIRIKIGVVLLLFGNSH